jgi:hypothetical protein
MKKTIGTFFTQLFSFYGEGAAALYGAFERGLCAGLANPETI